MLAVKTIKERRAYSAGIAGVALLVELTYQYKPLLTKPEFEGNLKKLFRLGLECVRCSRPRSEYKLLWYALRSEKNLEDRYGRHARELFEGKIKPYILREDLDWLYVHFLHGTKR